MRVVFAVIGSLALLSGAAHGQSYKYGSCSSGSYTPSHKYTFSPTYSSYRYVSPYTPRYTSTYSGYGSTSTYNGLPRTNYVSGYIRNNGTYVSPYYRSR